MEMEMVIWAGTLLITSICSSGGSETWCVVDVVEGLDRVGEVLGDGHGGGELLGELGVGSLPTTPTGTAGDRQSGGERRRLSSRGSSGMLVLTDAEPMLSLPNAISISSASTVSATGGGRTLGGGRGRLSSSCATVPSPGAGGEDWSNSITIEILYLTFVKHNSIDSRSSMMSAGSGR